MNDSRRFLRKPNVTEACESFTALGQQCEDVEMPVYAGLCWIAAARCEGSLGNIPGESTCLVRSARQFLCAEFKDKHLGCTSPSNENLQVSLHYVLVVRYCIIHSLLSFFYTSSIMHVAESVSI